MQNRICFFLLHIIFLAKIISSVTQNQKNGDTFFYRFLKTLRYLKIFQFQIFKSILF